MICSHTKIYFINSLKAPCRYTNPYFLHLLYPCMLTCMCSNLTHSRRDKMATILQTTVSNAFSWMKMYAFRLMSLKFVPKGPIDNITALVQIMAWRRLGDKPLSEPMMVRLLTHICVTRSECLIIHIPVCCARQQMHLNIKMHWKYYCVSRTVWSLNDRSRSMPWERL